MKNLSKLKRELFNKRLIGIKKELLTIVKEETIEPWLKTPNRAFDNLTPLQLIELGEHQRIYDMIYDIGSGNL